MQTGFRWLLFGDSWVISDNSGSWPELVAWADGGRTLNCAVGHSTSAALDGQLEQAEAVIARSDGGLHERATAIVHTGGNDLFFSTASQQASVAAAGAALVSSCGVCEGCALLSPPVRAFSRRVHALLRGLVRLGLRRFVIAGVPLTARCVALRLQRTTHSATRLRAH